MSSFSEQIICNYQNRFVINIKTTTFRQCLFDSFHSLSRENFHVLLPVALLEYLPPSHQRGHILVRLLSANKLVAYVIAHVASVSVKFRGKKRTRKWIFGFDRGRNETRAKK